LTVIDVQSFPRFHALLELSVLVRGDPMCNGEIRTALAPSFGALQQR